MSKAAAKSSRPDLQLLDFSRATCLNRFKRFHCVPAGDGVLAQGPPVPACATGSGKPANGVGQLPARGFEPEPQASVLFRPGRGTPPPALQSLCCCCQGPAWAATWASAAAGARVRRSVPAAPAAGSRARRRSCSCGCCWRTGRALAAAPPRPAAAAAPPLGEGPPVVGPTLHVAGKRLRAAWQQGFALLGGFVSSRRLLQGRAAVPSSGRWSGRRWAPPPRLERCELAVHRGSQLGGWPAGVSGGPQGRLGL